VGWYDPAARLIVSPTYKVGQKGTEQISAQEFNLMRVKDAKDSGQCTLRP